MNKAKVSIVVPIYNVEQYLAECINSLINQSYDNIEIILVDDGSPDASPSICDEYKGKDCRIRVFHKENGGVSDARNLGILEASGEWIMFLDADDYLSKHAIEKMVNVAQKFNADIVGTYFYRTYANTEICYTRTAYEESYEIDDSSEKIVREMIFFPERITQLYPTCLVPWGKIIKTKLIKENKLTFNTQMTLHEDAIFNMQLFSKVRKHAICSEPLIHYRQRKNSLTQISGKNYFDTNIKYCQMVKYLINEKILQIDMSENDYYTLCSKYYAYGMMNLWSYTNHNLRNTRKQLRTYREQEPFAEALNKIRLSELKKYNYSSRMNAVIKNASLKKYRVLMAICVCAYLREFFRERMLVGRKEMFK